MIGLKSVGDVKVATRIVVLVVASIVGSIVTVSGAIYASLREQAIAASAQQQASNLAIAMTILQQRFSGAELVWGESGEIERFQTWTIPPFFDTEIIDSITRVTGQDAIIYALAHDSGLLDGKSSSLIDSEGKRLSELRISSDDPVFVALASGSQFSGRMELAGKPYLVAIAPISKMTGTYKSAADSTSQMIGATLVGTPIEDIEATASSSLSLIAFVGGLVTVGLGAIGFFVARKIAKPIPQLAESMTSIANGLHDSEVPYIELGNEIGSMARAVDVFRQNAKRISQLTEAETIRLAAEEGNRQRMMDELQRAFGGVVDSAAAGDFSQRVTVEFSDPQLSGLAASVDRLVSVFDRSIVEIGQVLSAVAAKDLTRRASGRFEGALLRLVEDVNAVGEGLAEVVSSLRQASRSLRTATGEMLSGANELAERSTRQATSIEQTSATVGQLARTVVENAERARTARSVIFKLTETAEDGGRLMERATDAMSRITQSSTQIYDIVGLIEDIAFQTNLLALNASVEAARAGDAGKGFAVVAIEVRRLAQSAAQASDQIKNLIELSGQNVQNGSKLVADLDGRFADMIASARSSNELMGLITSACDDQVNALHAVAQTVRDVDGATQQNAALVEELNAAIEQTQLQARDLDDIVGQFKAGDVGEARARDAA